MKRRHIFLLGALALLLGVVGRWSAHLGTHYRRQLHAQPATAARWERQIRQSREQRDALIGRLAAVRTQPIAAVPIPAENAVPDSAQAAEIERWVRQVKQLKQVFERRPEQKIPELALLDDREWLRKARIVHLDTQDGLQRAFAIMRNAATNKFVQTLRQLLHVYLKENNGVLPADVDELRPYFHPTADPALFARYEMVRSGKLSDLPEGETVLKLKALINEDYDEDVTIEHEGGSLAYTSSSENDPEESRDDGNRDAQIEHDLSIAVRAFLAKNPGALPKSPAELIPYFDPPLGPALTELFSRPLTLEQQKRFPEDIAKLASGRRLLR